MRTVIIVAFIAILVIILVGIILGGAVTYQGGPSPLAL
jgi:ABC-type dipeptide/oligopeptide/nickel transport system permease subunit